MKRMLWGAGVAVAIAYSLISWRLGFAIEKQISASLLQLKGRTSYVSVVANMYRRGWFVSEQDITVELFEGLAAAPAGATSVIAPIEIKIHNVIWHGPICGLTCIGLARVRTHVDFGATLQAYLSSAFGPAEPLHLVSRMGFTGGGSGTVTSPSIKDAALSNGARVGWGGFKLQSEFSRDYDSYSLRGSMPKLSYAAVDNNRIEFDDFDFVARAQRELRTLYRGGFDATIGRISFSSSKTGAAILSNLRASQQSAVNNGYMSIVQKNYVATITASSLNLSEAHFDFSLNHLELDSLEQLSAAVQKVNQDVSLSAAQRGPIMLAAMKRPGIAFLSHAPQLALDRFSVAIGGGEARLSGTVTLNGVQESDFADGADPKVIVQKLDADLDLSIDDALLNGLPDGAKLMTQLQSFADQGLATHANGRFQAKVAFHQGMTTFDGKSLPQPAPPPTPGQRR